ncbi:ubiquinone biosynthesis protein UbiJ [Sphingomonas jinjuensis]|uniref:Ubiquinone biosynthesis protein UbiJ n=1 Tax=Sphingomonas jinjuensis TaxID=535907 RepID=A0A840FC33_9SPHN|nr:DUF4112 domain-containing protein [Sphingomonas jinjuensis]MBB4153334.1 ubiquinone biosynthesis protein UbiJ [Sphingomonas jinjuensis]
MTTIDPAVFDRLPLGRDPAAVRRRIEAMEALLEGMFTVPGLNRRVGLDFILGLVPVVGDVAAAALGSWLVWEARNLGMSRWQLTRMMGRVGFDAAIGLIPFVGDAADFFYRSNTRNLKTIKRHLDRHHPGTVTIDS